MNLLGLEDLLDLGLVDICYERDAADVGHLMGDRGDIVAVDVVQRELAPAGHHLAEALAHPREIRVDADSPGRELIEAGAEAPPQLGSGDEDLVLAVPEALDVDGDLAGVDAAAAGVPDPRPR